VLYEHDDTLTADEIDDVAARQRAIDRIRIELLREVDLDQLVLVFPERDVYRRPVVNVCRSL